MFTRLTAILMLCGLLAAAGLTAACGPEPCPTGPGDWDHCLFVEIGTFQSKDAGMRAAIKRLAIETKRCPLTNMYQIAWIMPSNDSPSEREHPGDRVALLYDGDERMMFLGYEHDPLSGSSGRQYVVDRAAIEAVAAKGGTLEDFEQYDRSTPEERKRWGTDE